MEDPYRAILHWVSLAYFFLSEKKIGFNSQLFCSFCFTGRNRKHQGLAAAIIKLWERCEIVKIAVKRGVQNTNSELMAEELKVNYCFSL